MENEKLNQRLDRLEAHLHLIQEQCDALQEVIGWLLSRHPDDAEMFLACQANEFEESPKLAPLVPTFDELRTLLASWRELQTSAQAPEQG